MEPEKLILLLSFGCISIGIIGFSILLDEQTPQPFEAEQIDAYTENTLVEFSARIRQVNYSLAGTRFELDQNGFLFEATYAEFPAVTHGQTIYGRGRIKKQKNKTLIELKSVKNID